MKRIEIQGKENAQLVEVDKPQAGPKDIVVRVKACGICGSDLKFFKIGGLIESMVGTPLPIGHEFSGVVESIGKDVETVAVGDRIVVNPARGGNIGFGGSEGAFAAHVLVRDAVMNGNVFKIPTSMPFEVAALVEPFNVGMHAVDRSDLQVEDKVVVFGAGPIGLSIISTLHFGGFENVVAIDLSEHRLNLASQLGATTILNAGQVDVWKELRQLHGESSYFGASMAGKEALYSFLFFCKNLR